MRTTKSDMDIMYGDRRLYVWFEYDPECATFTGEVKILVIIENGDEEPDPPLSDFQIWDLKKIALRQEGVDLPIYTPINRGKRR